MIFVKWHMGIGDIIATAAIVNKLSHETGEEIIVPTYAHNEESVKSIFVNVPNVKTCIVNNDEDFYKDCKTFSLGYYSPIKQREDEDFVQWFYRQAGMAYEERVKWCPVQEAAKKVKQTRVSDRFPYDFIHDVGSIGVFRIDYQTDRMVFRPGKHGSILQYVDLLKNATEIHCIDSSFFHLVESVETTGKLFYHKLRPNSTYYNSIKQWICK